MFSVSSRFYTYPSFILGVCLAWACPSVLYIVTVTGSSYVQMLCCLWKPGVLDVILYFWLWVLHFLFHEAAPWGEACDRYHVETRTPQEIRKSCFLKLLFKCTLVFCLHVCQCKGVRHPETGVTDSYELPRGCWELNPGPLEEQSVLITTEPSPQAW